MMTSESSFIRSVIVVFEYKLAKNFASKSTLLSCSGILLDISSGIVLTSASLISSLFCDSGGDDGLPNSLSTLFLEDKFNGNMSSVPLFLNEFVSYEFSVIIGNIVPLNQNKSEHNRNLNKDHKSNVYKADFVGMWCNDELKKDLGKLITNNFRFVDNRMNGEVFKKVFSSFLVLRVRLPHSFNLPHDMKCSALKFSPKFRTMGDVQSESESCEKMNQILNRIGSRIKNVEKGEDVWTESSLFAYSHPVFMNSLSRGVVVNTYGTIFLTDARCTPGSEGGLVYQKLNDKRYWTGIILSSFCWNKADIIGLALACKAHPIITTIFGQQLVSSSLHHGLCSDHSSRLTCGVRSVVMVKVGSSWGSGIVIDKTRGIIITCSHVTNSASQVLVQAEYPQFAVAKANVLYQSPKTESYDVAVLQLIENITLEEAFYQKSILHKGQEILAVGHGLFSDPSQFGILITSGVISKIVYMKEEPVLIQTSCAIYGGVSGGALIDANSGNVIGMAVSNAKDLTNDVTYPNVSFAIPIEQIIPVLQKFLQTKDVSHLNSLHVQDLMLQRLWTLTDLPGNKFSKL